ncbi:MAG TPA: transglycosylase domain-containing protein [Candidatus Dormibacteraeota bacterium]|nr:transglycosylase domain-containing protein [Candidatus Dormibacteraeota bacterium]
MRFRRRRVAAMAAVVLVGSGLFAWAHAVGLDRLPSVDAVMRSALPNDTLVYDRTGTVLLADIQQPGSQHTDVSLGAMGRWLPGATVATDDPGFWSEPGIDPGRIAGAAAGGVRGQSGGDTGSTIVTRLIRLRLGQPEGLAGRVRAAALAVRVAAAVPKERILAAYLNALPYGNRAVGVEAAAITYFQIDAAQLDLAQATLIAGLPEAPNDLDPLHNLPGAKARQREVLDAMVRSHAIGREQADQAAAEPLRILSPTNLFVAPDFVHYVEQELTSRYGQGALSQPGFTVISTLDWGLQQQAERALQQALDANQARRVSAGALTAVDPRTGEILALAAAAPSGRVQPQYDFAFRTPRSPGSTFRMFTYAAAIASGRYTMVTPVTDAPITIEMGQGEPSYQPRNFDQRSHGVCELRACLGNGLDVPAVEVEFGTGIPAVLATARALGAPPLVPHFSPDGTTLPFTTDDPPATFGPSLTLGGYGETPLLMATGAATLAAGGVRRDAEALQRVVRSDGQAIFQARPGAGTRAIDAGAAYVAGQMLSDDADRVAVYGPASPLSLPGRHAAAVSGTAETFSDAWTVGYTPSLAAAVWMGNADYGAMQYGTDGGILVAAPAWHQFMQAALDQLGKGDDWYTPPGDVRAADVNGRPAWFLPGTSPATPAPPLPANVHVGG